jgi:uncharacterized membrane protein YqhA
VSPAPEEERRKPSELVGRMVASSRFFVLIATLSLFLAFMAVMVSTIIVTVTTILHAVAGDLTQNEMIGKLIKQADYALLATVLYVLALGLYGLFVDDRVPMPTWLRISDLGQLKELLAGVVVVAIAVIFLGQALTWDGVTDLLAPGLASAAVIAALALFLWQAARERHGPGDRTTRICPGRPGLRRGRGRRALSEPPVGLVTLPAARAPRPRSACACAPGRGSAPRAPRP